MELGKIIFLKWYEGVKKMIIRKPKEEDIKGIAKVNVDSWRTTYKGIVPDDFLNRMRYDEREVAARKTFESIKTLQYVAESEEKKIVGYVHGGKNRYTEDYPEFDAEIYAIYILKDYQGHSIGSKLIQHLVEELVSQGFKSLIVQVLAENRSKEFYQKAGARYLDTRELDISGEKLEELVYAWEDIKRIISR